MTGARNYNCAPKGEFPYGLVCEACGRKVLFTGTHHSEKIILQEANKIPCSVEPRLMTAKEIEAVLKPKSKPQTTKHRGSYQPRCKSNKGAVV